MINTETPVIGVEQSIANKVTNAENKKDTKTRQVSITVSALTKMEYTTTIDVPIDTDRQQLEEIGAGLFKTIDPCYFTQDEDYWEKCDVHWTLED